MAIFRVIYSYSDQGMEGNSVVRNLGEINANSSEDAKDMASMMEYPADEFYGPQKKYSARMFFRGCLTTEEKSK